jgi:uncharacterized Fe-S cluster-containing radical SAM superfamily protein
MKPYLNILDVTATVGCNLSCNGCNHLSNYFSPNSKLNTDQLIEDIKTILSRMDIDRVSLIGGEPLLNPRCEEILETCIEYSSNFVYLYTNGILLNKNKKWIEKSLANEKVFLRVSIHLDEKDEHGTTATTNFKNFYEQSAHKDKILLTEHHNGNDKWFNSIHQEVKLDQDIVVGSNVIAKARDSHKVYPYNHNKIKKSFKICSCPNTQLYEGKLWKCANSAYLKDMLHVTNQLEDESWKPYLDMSKGLSVHCSDEELYEFCENNLKAQNICNMCTSLPVYHAASQIDTPKKVIISQ